MKPRRDGANRQLVCVHKHTYVHTGSTAVFGQSTVVRDLICGGPLWLRMHANYKNHFIPSPLLLASQSVLEVYDIHLLPISWRFRFHQVSDEARLCFLKEPGHSLTPSSYRHNTKCLSDSPHGKESVVSCLTLFFILSNINNNVTSISSQYIGLVWQ